MRNFPFAGENGTDIYSGPSQQAVLILYKTAQCSEAVFKLHIAEFQRLILTLLGMTSLRMNDITSHSSNI